MIKIKKVFLVFMLVVLHNTAQGMKRDHEAEKRYNAIQPFFLQAVEEVWSEEPTKGSKDDFALIKTPAKKIKLERVIQPEVKLPVLTILELGNGNRSYQCDECPYSTGHAKRASAHSRIHALTKKGFTAVLQCPSQCGYITLDSRRMKEHLISHKTEKDQECPVCDFKTKNERSMKRHMKLLHPEKS